MLTVAPLNAEYDDPIQPANHLIETKSAELGGR